MKRFQLYTAALLFSIMLSYTPSAHAQSSGTLFQSSPITALLKGYMNGNFKVGDISKYGDLGLGTFNGVNGEMIVLDGKVYQIKYDGKVYLPSADVKTPFAAVTFFHPDTEFVSSKEMDFKELNKFLDGALSSQNNIYAFKISGYFTYMETRSEMKQEKEYTNLVDVLKDQVIFKFNNVKGDLVGFKFPGYLSGVNAKGFHFHFIDDKRDAGGHVLGLKTGKIKIEIERIKDLKMIIPSGKEYDGLNLGDGKSASHL